MDEPFSRLLTQGMVIKDGSKMSKSKGNVVDPDELIRRYGADTVRLFCLFASPPERDLDWNDQGVEGSFRFLHRVWNLVLESQGENQPGLISKANPALEGSARSLRLKVNQTIKKVTEDIEERFHFNTAISAIMELVNAAYLFRAEASQSPAAAGILSKAVKTILILLSPIVPHLCEELWETLGNEGSVQKQPWPEWDPEALTEDEQVIVIQVNGKLRSRMVVGGSIGEEEIKASALNQTRIREWLQGKEVAKVILVPKKLVNIVVK